MNLGDLNKVWEIKALKKPGQEEAMKTLDRIAKQVQPIMRKHNWRVKLLSEFCPTNPALLGVNVGGGINVKLRLRRPNRDWDFYPYDQVLDTMLHELCHNAYGPHNASFYKLWDQLRKECEELMAKGISGTGEGFDLPGRRLGGFSRQLPLSSARAVALAAAEKRSQTGLLLPSGPRRLGGDNTIKSALSPIQAAAMAAERRLQDDLWCMSMSCEASEAGESCSNGISNPHGDPSSSHSGLIPKKRGRETEIVSSSQSLNCQNLGSSFVDLTCDSASPSMPNCHDDDDDEVKEIVTWECRSCTLLNPPLAPVCEVCGTKKSRELSTKYKVWCCKFCTLENSRSSEKCCACSQWRYSHGPPVASAAPNVGT